eukprot:scaffold3569_cov84-Amphora_coffeaeformis.AAC.1
MSRGTNERKGGPQQRSSSPSLSSKGSCATRTCEEPPFVWVLAHGIHSVRLMEEGLTRIVIYLSQEGIYREIYRSCSTSTTALIHH